jgi:hypothetical protein
MDPGVSIKNPPDYQIPISIFIIQNIRHSLSSPKDPHNLIKTLAIQVTTFNGKNILYLLLRACFRLRLLAATGTDMGIEA